MSLTLTLALLLLLLLPAASRANDGCTVAATITIDAKPKVVWNAIRDQGSEVDKRRIISVGNHEAVIEETFENLPVIHSSKCLIQEHETPYERIDYHMLQSDKLKALAGSWILTPTKSGKTLLELTSTLDTGIHMPFSKKIANNAALARVQRRLTVVKELAEAKRDELAQASP